MASPPSSPNLKDHGFTPRREFIRDPKPPPNSFSLLAISSSSFIRLYSFTPSVITSLNTYLRQAGLLQTFREDVPKQFFEFSLEGKPWSSPKSVASERLLIEILSIVSHHGYNFLSTLDYGRESDDRLALAFSRPAALSQSSSPSPTPIPPHNGSGTTLSSKLRSYPFALSFPSMTTLRVICPPLHSTPAILQAVRGAWPRGVEAEKKIGDYCFEFKLKGYKWFHEDTFATDSLQHILGLLSALDTHGFELQTSISLTNTRSRVKDLWIFTGPSSVDDFPLRDSLSALKASPEPSRLALSPDPFGAQHTPMQSHRRLVTDPLTSPRPASPMRHGRAVTDDPHAQAHNDTRVRSPVSPTPSNLLRKPAPRAQVPVSVHDDGDHGNAEGYRTILPSTIPSGVENMTGVGAVTPDVFYSTSPLAQSPIEPVMTQPVRSPSPDIPPVDEPPSAQVSDPPEPLKEDQEVTYFPDTGHLSGPLLSPSAFRDSAVSATTDVSAVIPIKWTGQGAEHMDENGRIPSTPMFPGGWQPTPVYEKDEQLATETLLDIHLDQDKQPEQPIQDVRVASPQMMDGEVRQSEAGLIINSAAPLAPLQEEKEEDSGDGEAARRQTAASSGQGWVLVNVEAQSAETAQLAGPPGPSSQGDGTAAGSALEVAPNSASQTSSPLPPAAKAIVIIDAVESKKKAQSSSRLKRLLSITRKDSEEDEKDKPKVHSRTLSMGQKLRQIGTPEATRNEDKRRSFD